MTKFYFQRVQEHPKRSSDENVMTFLNWRSHMSSQPFPASLPDLPWPTCPFLPDIISTSLKIHMDGIWTQWVFHIVQEHPKQSSDEAVMTFRSWRSQVVKPSRSDLTWPSSDDLAKLTYYPIQVHIWNLDRMEFP